MPIKAWLLVAVLLLSGCSANPYTAAVDMLTGGSKGPSLDVSYESEKTKGDKHEDNEINVGQSETKQTATTIINNQEIPVEFLLLCVIGWLLPSPNEMWRGLKDTVKGIFMFWRK